MKRILLLASLLFASNAQAEIEHYYSLDVGYITGSSEHLYEQEYYVTGITKLRWGDFGVLAALGQGVDKKPEVSMAEISYTVTQNVGLFFGMTGTTFGLQPVYLTRSVTPAKSAITTPLSFRAIRNGITESDVGAGLLFSYDAYNLKITTYTPRLRREGGNLTDPAFYSQGDRDTINGTTGTEVSPRGEPIIELEKSLLGFAPLEEELKELFLGKEIPDATFETGAMSISLTRSGLTHNLTLDVVAVETTATYYDEDEKKTTSKNRTIFTAVGAEKFFSTATSVGAELFFVGFANGYGDDIFGYNAYITQEVGEYNFFVSYFDWDEGLVKELNYGMVRSFAEFGHENMFARLAHHQTNDGSSNTLAIGLSF